jgi:AcrR family transcriptional regulator
MKAAKPKASPKRRRTTKEETRDALIASGMELFAKRGIDGPSLDDICAHAGLTRGAFYVHFADRDAFLVAVMQHVLGGFVGSLTGLDAPDLKGALRTFIRAVGTPALHPAKRASGAIRFHQVMEACRRSPSIGEGYRRLLLLGRDAVAALVARDQSVRKASARGIADLSVVFALGVAALLELEVPIDLADLERTMLELVA